jgi:hypothetical protein
MTPYKSPHPQLPDEHMRLVGIISAHWEWVELILEVTVAEVMEHEFRRVQLLTSTMNFTNKSDLIKLYGRTALETHDPEGWKELCLHLATLRAAYGLRNKYVHATWSFDRRTGEPIRTEVVFKGGKGRAWAELAPIAELNKAAQDMWDAGEAMIGFFRRYGMLSASAEKSELRPHEDRHDPPST